MFLRLIILFLLCAELCGKDKIKTYWEEDGIIAVDLEDFEAKKPWKKETELSGFAGKSYYTWRGGNSYRGSGGGVMEFKIIITKPGDYFLNIHNRHEHKDHTLENDCYTQMDDGRWVKTFSSKRAVWFWQSTHEWDHKTKIPAKYTLSAGVHTFRISGRSHGFSIDRFHIWHSNLNKKTTQSLDVKLSDSDSPEIPKEISDKRLISYWKSGKLGMVIKESNAKLSKGQDEQASKAIETIEEFIAKRKDQLHNLRELAPSLAYQSLKELASSVSYTEHDKKIKAELLELSRDKSFMMSLKSEKIYKEAIETIQKSQAKLVKGKPKPLSKRTAGTLLKALKEIKRYTPNSAFYDNLAIRLEKLGLIVE